MNRIISILLLVILIFGCSDHNQSNEIIALQTEVDSLKKYISESSVNAERQVTTFLTFQENNAEEAMNFYVSLFDNSKIVDVQRYGKEGPAKEGTIMMARFELNGSKFACSDSYVQHEWTFTPGVSNWVDCKSNDEIEYLFEKLTENGKTLMPLGNYGFSTKFAFVEDRFGVSWQLNLE